MSIRKLPILGLLALAAACGGGGDDTETAATADTSVASGTPTVTTTPSTPAPTAGAPVTPDEATGSRTPRGAHARTDGRAPHSHEQLVLRQLFVERGRDDQLRVRSHPDDLPVLEHDDLV